MKIIIPVAPAKRETILKAKPTEIHLNPGHLILKKMYIKNIPTDWDDEYSPVKEERFEIELFVKKSSIDAVNWFYSDYYEVYKLEMNYGHNDWDLNMENRDKAMELYDQLIKWLYETA